MVSSLYAIAIPVIAVPLIYKRYLSSQVVKHMQDPNPKESLGVFADAEVLAKVDIIKAYTEGTSPKLASDRSAWAMAWLHEIVWHSFKSMYYYADKILPGDYASYREYSLLTVDHLVAHHDSEEAVLFPQLEAKWPGSMVLNEAQHAAFLPTLGKIKEYLLNATEESQFDAKVFREMVTPLVLPLFTHLADELDTLRGDKLRAVCTEDELMAISAASHPPQDSHTKYKLLPFMIQSLRPTATFPPAPKLVTKVVTPWVFGWKHQHIWKYTAFPWTNKTGYTVPPQ